MKKTRQQEAAWNYAIEMLDRLLDMEDMVGHRVEKKFNEMVETKFGQLEKG